MTRDQHEAVYIGGPKHGECWPRRGDAAPEIVMRGVNKEYLYRLDPLADIPGALAYIYEPQETKVMIPLSEEEHDLLDKQKLTHLMRAARELMEASEIVGILELHEEKAVVDAAINAIRAILDKDGI